MTSFPWQITQQSRDNARLALDRLRAARTEEPALLPRSDPPVPLENPQSPGLR